MRAEMDLPNSEQWNPSPFTDTHINSKSTSDILTETTAKRNTKKICILIKIIKTQALQRFEKLDPKMTDYLLIPQFILG